MGKPNTTTQSGAIQACGRTLAADPGLSMETGAHNSPTTRADSDKAALSRLFPQPATEDPLRTLLYQQRAAALGQRRFPGIANNLLTAAQDEPNWRRALICLSWSWFIHGTKVESNPWEARCNSGLEAHWRQLAASLDHPPAFETSLNQLLPLLAARLAGLGIQTAVPMVIPTAKPGGDQDTAPGEAEDTSIGDQTRATKPSPTIKSAALPKTFSGPVNDYRIYSRRYDQELEARQLLSPNELTMLRNQLDQGLAELPRLPRRLAAKLRQALQAQALRHWQFHQEEGLLDVSRLSSFIATKGQDKHIFKRLGQASFEPAAVTLLIDNSGSMKGRPILLAALCTELITQALEQCGVAVEILGFTTRYGEENPLETQWQQAAGPASPGRLNALRHIVYKAADTSWRKARRAIPAMLHEPLLKENIDGEALLWAHARLLRRVESRRILLVISDGAPMDNATTNANGRIYLDRHLSEVANWIEQHSPVQLLAVGIGHDVYRYYHQAITIPSVETLAETLLEQLGETLLGGDVC